MYNAENYISETLARLKNQTYDNIEVILVDDHSTDNSVSIAHQAKLVNLIILRNVSKGACAARNFAFYQSKGKFIKFMDADDYCSETMIEDQVTALSADENLNSVSFSNVIMLFDDRDPVKPKRLIDKDFVPAIELQVAIWNNGGFNCPHCYLIPRHIVEQSGGWNENLIKNQDGEFFARILALSEKAVFISTASATWRQTGTGISAQTSNDALRSVIESYHEITKTLIGYDKNYEKLCAENMGKLVFANYPQIKPLLPFVYSILEEIKAPLVLPNRKLVKIVRPILGWEYAVLLSKAWDRLKPRLHNHDTY